MHFYSFSLWTEKVKENPYWEKVSAAYRLQNITKTNSY